MNEVSEVRGSNHTLIQINPFKYFQTRKSDLFMISTSPLQYCKCHRVNFTGVVFCEEALDVFKITLTLQLKTNNKF